MNRAQRRKQAKGQSSKAKTYSVTAPMINGMVQQSFSKQLKEQKQDAQIDSFMLMMTIPFEVLLNHYEFGTDEERVQFMSEFAEHVLDYYEKWINDELDMAEMQKHLWEYGGIKLKRE